MIAMMVFAVYANDKSYEVPIVKNIKARIDEMEVQSTKYQNKNR